MKRFLIILMLMISCLTMAQTRDTCIISNIRFEVNSVIPVYDNNYQYFINDAVPYLNTHIDDLKQINITGSASPEGSFNGNKTLSIKRANALINTIGSIPSDKIHIQAISENYDMLYDLISKSNEPYKNEVLRVLDEGGNIKNNLMKLDCWNDLLKYYFPKLRYTSISMNFSHFEPCTNTIYVHDTLYLYIPQTIIQNDTIYITPTIKKYPVLSFKTNLLEDLIGAVNAHAELFTYLWGISLEYEHTFPWWKNDDKYIYYQLLNGMVGIRKYFNNDYSKWYIGVYGNTGYYDFSLDKDTGRQGEHRGAGMSAGYVWRKGNWRFEAFGRVGWLNSNYDKYHAGQPFEGRYYYDWVGKNEDFIPRRFNLNYVGPTMIGFSIGYDLIRFRRYEIIN